MITEDHVATGRSSPGNPINFDQFIFEFLRPEVLGSPLHLPGRPVFFADDGALSQCLVRATQIGVLLPFLQGVLRAPWHRDLHEGVVIRFEERLSRERLIQAIQSQELDRVVEVLAGERIPAALGAGGDMARRYYPARTLRGVTGVELMVPPGLGFQALRALGQAGYRSEKSGQLARGKMHPSVTIEEADAEAWDRTREGCYSDLPINVRALDVVDRAVERIDALVLGGLPLSIVGLNDVHFVLARANGAHDAEFLARLLLARRRGGAALSVLEALKVTGRAVAVSGVLEKLIRPRAGVLRRRALRGMASADAWLFNKGVAFPRTLRRRLLLSSDLG